MPFLVKEIYLQIQTVLIRLEEANGSSHPRLVLVVLDTDHFAPAQTRKVRHQLRTRHPLFPNEKQPDLHFDSAIWRLKCWLILHFALQYEIRTLILWNQLEVGGFDVEYNARTRE